MGSENPLLHRKHAGAIFVGTVMFQPFILFPNVEFKEYDKAIHTVSYNSAGLDGKIIGFRREFA